jgi:hypothetical protein
MKTLWMPLRRSIHLWLLWGARIGFDIICPYLLTVTQIYVYLLTTLFLHHIGRLVLAARKNTSRNSEP